MATDLNNSRPRTRRSRKYHRNRNMKITIESNKTLLEILDDKRKVMKLLIIIVVLAMTIFIGLSFVTVSIKSVYPYNSIMVNAFGTTTMQDEDKEIHYWLFNTAELWANSGIYVEKGDRLTIRSSGKFNTAIHHMIHAADSNSYNFDWLGSEGSKSNKKRDEQRMDFRIFSKLPANALIMQVAPDDVSIDSLITCKDENKKGIYFIGKERVDFIVPNEGYLRFAVNDIVLTEDVINKMIARNDSLIRDAIIKSLQDKSSIKSEIMSKQVDSLFSDEETWRKFNKEFLDFGPAPKYNKLTKDTNEMTYYRDFHKKMYDEKSTDSVGTYYNAWFDDNVGSFLIAVEHIKSKP